MWTSHTDPATLANDSATDLRGVTRWWTPNGSACNPGFLVPREKEGETVWFYHSGHPCIGVHGVNATGVELRTWGTICWRYKVNGSFWWAMDMGDPKTPLTKPCYKPDDTRWGNGVLFYPGARLSDLGLPAIDGPLSCLRMKAYRRGLQDYEYGWLQNSPAKKLSSGMIVKNVPVALTTCSRQSQISPPTPNRIPENRTGRRRQHRRAQEQNRPILEHRHRFRAMHHRPPPARTRQRRAQIVLFSAVSPNGATDAHDSHYRFHR